MAAVDLDDLTDCENVASNLGRQLSEAGFGRVSAGDVPYPPLWDAYSELRGNTFVPKPFEAPTP